ncbi:uracil-DNA glycosylase [Marivita sp. XM-24bin2]|uniref:uracil-DNA glycosylase n=1 Tax=unclassified Marivita TaxID=2632480 RepID=UPI000D7AF145|nr:uracil-DNA glycosylase [Marivita sp. XM-24bin2]MCR9108733.1 uracil-DNA glycosylase [Paracoccaceae bacterium]PWL35920.1 MAG: uracil-DNA glycosylase [Marivita sp. XM-24bin2]
MLTPPDKWRHLPFFSENLPGIAAAVAKETRAVLPPESQVFAALETCSPEDVRVVILGQDPYPTPGHAHGLAFSVSPSVQPLPRSLGNIFKELRDDVGSAPPNGDLHFWARQGVLLLNDVLTVPAGDARGHRRLGWQKLVPQVLEALSDRPRAFVLWGNDARAQAQHLAGHGHLVLESAHPSPLSARRGFFGSRPFSTVNAWLKEQGQQPINWTDP